MKLEIGTAPDSWGVWFPSDEKQIDWARYLDEARAAGYGWTELGPFGYMPTDGPRLESWSVPLRIRTFLSGRTTPVGYHR